MRRWLGFFTLLLSMLSSSGLAGIRLDFEAAHREQLSLRGLVNTVQESGAEIHDGHEEARRRLCHIAFTPLGFVTEYLFYYTEATKAGTETIEREAFTYAYDGQKLLTRVDQLSTSTYGNQRQNSVYAFRHDAAGRLTEVAVTTKDAASSIFDGQVWKTSYRYDTQGRLAEKLYWVESGGVRRPETMQLMRYTPQLDGMLIEEIGQDGRRKGKVTNRTWLDPQGRIRREFTMDDHDEIIGKCFYAYNDHGDLIKRARVSKSGQTTVTYRYARYDAQGNWTEQTESWAQPGVENGAAIPHRTAYRTLTYYHTPAIQAPPTK